MYVDLEKANEEIVVAAAEFESRCLEAGLTTEQIVQVCNAMKVYAEACAEAVKRHTHYD